MFAAGELAMTAHDLALGDTSMIAQSVLEPEIYKQMFTEVNRERKVHALRPWSGCSRFIRTSRDRHGGKCLDLYLKCGPCRDGAAVVVLTNQ